MQRRHVELWAPGIEAHGVLLAYGHWGRPLLVFPSERGRAWEYETGGMVHAIAPLIEAGRVKLSALPSTLLLAERLAEKGIRHELDLWGHDVAHDWPSWRAQIAHHLPRFC